MTMNLHDFRLASHGHRAGARVLLDTNCSSETGSPPAKLPSTAAYLASVSLECSIKARLLARGGFDSTDDLKTKQPSVYKALFSSKEGHDLGRLAQSLRLSAFVKAEGKVWHDDDVWKRMGTSHRPYSLRYGSEHLTKADAEAELKRVEELSETLLSGLGKTRKPRSKP
jgi:hypothetical protein